MSRASFWATAFVLAVATLYPTVYLHELAHSAAAYILECKSDWWTTDTSPILYGSYGGAIDYACLRTKGAWAVAAVDGAGVVANISLLALALVWAGAVHVRLIRAFLLIFAAANYVEAFSYLAINTIVLRSDMIAVVTWLRVDNVVFGAFNLLVAVVFGRPLLRLIGDLGPPAVSRSRVILAATAAAALVGGVMVQARSSLTEGAVPAPLNLSPSPDCDTRAGETARSAPRRRRVRPREANG